MLFLLWNSADWLKWSSSETNSSAIVTQQNSFSTYISTFNFGVISGPVTNTIYYMYYAYNPDSGMITKTDSSSNLIWLASVLLNVIKKSLAIDSLEQTLYFATNSNPMIIFRLNTTDEAILKLFRSNWNNLNI